MKERKNMLRTVAKIQCMLTPLRMRQTSEEVIAGEADSSSPSPVFTGYGSKSCEKKLKRITFCLPLCLALKVVLLLQ